MTTHRSDLSRRLSAQTIWRSPLGDLLLARTPIGLAGAWFAGQKDHPGELTAPSIDDDPVLQSVIVELGAYFDGRAVRFTPALDLHGTPFQLAVWRELLRIDAGQTCSYAAIARAIGAPSAVRAVGSAIGKNPVSVIVPCHRVIGSGGSLTGYAGGLDRKRALLALENGIPGQISGLVSQPSSAAPLRTAA